MNIRKGNPEEIDIVYEIVRNATRHMDENGIPQWDEIYPNRNILQNDINKQELYVFERENKILGLIVLNENQSPEYDTLEWKHNGRVLVIHRLTIDPQYQRQRIASQMMDFAEKYALLKGYTSIRLDAFVNNPAAFILYENRGYDKAGIVHFRKGKFFCFEKAVSL